MRPVIRAEPMAPALRATPRAAQTAAPAPAPKSVAGARPGPGPSKLAYRVTRAWAKPAVRAGVLVYLPMALLGLAGWRLAADDWARGHVVAAAQAAYDLVAERPEFAVHSLVVTGGSPGLRDQVRDLAALGRGVSSWKLDVTDLRARIEAIGAVQSAAVQVDAQGVLRVTLVERVAAALSRDPDGALVVLDGTGVSIGPAGTRADHPGLPLVLGEGAPAAMAEALALVAAAPDLAPRIRALVRVGQRRWDIVLDRDVVIQLPEADPIPALARVMALHYGDEILDRDLATIDLRVPDRPTLRLSQTAAETYELRKSVGIEGKDT